MKNKTIKNMFQDYVDKDEIYNRVLEGKEIKGQFYYSHQFVGMAAIALVVFLVILVASKSEIGIHSDSSFSSSESSIYINEIGEEYYTSYSKKDGVFSFITDENQNASSSFSTTEEYRMYIAVPEDLKLVSQTSKEKEKSKVIETFYQSEGATRSIKIQYSDFDFISRKYKMDGTKVSRVRKTSLAVFREGEMLVSIFRYQDVYYFIQTKGIDEQELIQLLESIIKE